MHFPLCIAHGHRNFYNINLLVTIRFFRTRIKQGNIIEKERKINRFGGNEAFTGGNEREGHFWLGVAVWPCRLL